MADLNSIFADIETARASHDARLNWNPARVGEIDICIAADGSWHHEGRPFSVLITVLWDPEGRVGYNSDQQIHLHVESALARVRPSALETRIPIHRLAGRNLVGEYFRATDRAPKPGEFRYLTQGCAALDDLMLTFTVLSNDERGIVAREALAMLQGARKEAA